MPADSPSLALLVPSGNGLIACLPINPKAVRTSRPWSALPSASVYASPMTKIPGRAFVFASGESVLEFEHDKWSGVSWFVLGDVCVWWKP